MPEGHCTIGYVSNTPLKDDIQQKSSIVHSLYIYLTIANVHGSSFIKAMNCRRVSALCQHTVLHTQSSCKIQPPKVLLIRSLNTSAQCSFLGCQRGHVCMTAKASNSLSIGMSDEEKGRKMKSKCIGHPTYDREAVNEVSS